MLERGLSALTKDEVSIGFSPGHARWRYPTGERESVSNLIPSYAPVDRIDAEAVAAALSRWMWREIWTYT